jgi:hypothetical protein
LRFLLLPPLLLCAVPAAAQRLGGGAPLNISLIRVVMALLLCLMIAGAVVLLLKRNGGRIDTAALRRLLVRLPAERRIDIVETRRISQHGDVCLLRCDGREYLVLSAEGQMTVLRDAEAKLG